MRAMRKITALVAALGLAAAGGIPPYAAETEAATTSMSYNTKNLSDGQGADPTITGHIQITNISVRVLITSSFDIDSNKKTAASADATAQMGQQAENYMITNLSTVSLDISITKMEPSARVTLVDTVNDLSADKNILFVTREANEAASKLPGTENDAIWVNRADIAGGTPYYVKDGSVYAVQAADDTMDRGRDTLKAKAYVATKKDWKSRNSFIITPTSTMSLTTGASTP